jgi:succinate dehydrogenase/fumarate reductase flavoprotein subunit
MSEPSTAELARDLRQLEARVDRERTELLSELRRGFSELRSAIDAQSAERITREVYTSDQRRFETEMSQLREDFRQLRDDVHTMKRWLVYSMLGVIVVAVVAGMVMRAAGL